MSTIGLRQSAVATGTGNSRTVTLGSAPVAGNLLVLTYVTSATGGAAGEDLQVPTGWNRVLVTAWARKPDTGILDGFPCGILWRVVPAGYSASTTFDLDGTSAHRLCLSEWQGWRGTPSLGAADVEDDRTSSPFFTADLTPVPGYPGVAIAAWNIVTSTSRTVGSGWTELDNGSDGSFGRMLAEYKLLDPPAGTISPNGTFSGGTQEWGGLSAVFADSLPIARGRLRDIQYHAFVHSPSGSGGPGLRKLDLTPDMLNLSWQKNLSLPSAATLTLTRFNPKLTGINYNVDHISIWRRSAAGTVQVFAGKIVKPDEDARDDVLYCWDYLAYLQRSRTGLNVLYPNKKIGTEIVAPEWALAQAVADSPLAFVATGTIEDPLGSDGSTLITTNEDFGVNLFNRLFVFYAMAEMSMANTANSVVLEITRTSPHTFNFWKNKSTQRTSPVLIYPGNLTDQPLIPGYDQIVNDLSTIINDPDTGEEVEYNITDATSIATYKRLQDATQIKTLIGITTSSLETDQHKAALNRLLKEATRNPIFLQAVPRQGEFDPFIDADVADTMRVILQKPDRSGAKVDAYLRLVAIEGFYGADTGESLVLSLTQPVLP